MTGELILVVEDEAPMRRFLCSALASHGFRVAEAGTLAQAERAATDSRPAAVLLDLGMPDGDGLELLRRIREWSAAPVIVLSARDREDDKVIDNMALLVEWWSAVIAQTPDALGEQLQPMREAVERRRADA